MKTKKQLFKALILLIGMIGFMACSEKTEDKGNTPAPPAGTSSLKVTPGKLNFTAEGGTLELKVTTTYDYFGYDFTADWISADFKDDPTYNIITITAKPNTSPTARTTTIKVTGSNSQTSIDETVNITIEQEGKESSGSYEYTTISKAGGEVSVEDMSISFPANTFSSDASIGVAKAESGSIRGDEEASAFYKVELPVDTRESFKVSIKAEKSDDIQMIAHAASVSISGNMQQGESDVVLESTYKDGTYIAEVPAFDNNGESGSASISFGMVKKGQGTKGARTRGTTKDPSITFYLDWSRKYDWSLSTQEIIEDAATDAINAILGLGFKVKGTRNIPIVIKALSDEGAYGYFKQSAFSDKWSTIEINSKMLNGDKDELRQTVYHEMFHYFQSEYDPRCCFSKFRNVYRDLLMLIEAGGVWIEKLAGNGYSGIMKQNADIVVRSFDPVKELYKGTPGEGREYQAHGYGMGIVLEHLSQETSDKSILKLYEAMKEGASTTKDCVQQFKDKAGYDFFWNYDEFALKVVTGELIDGFGFSNVREGGQMTLKDDKIQTVEGKVYPYGTKVKQFKIDKGYVDKNGSNSMKNKALLAEEMNDYVNTYIYIQKKGDKNGKELGHIYRGDQFMYDDQKVLEKAMDGATYFYLVTLNTTNVNVENSKLEVALAEVKVPKITKVAVSYGYTTTDNETMWCQLPWKSSGDYSSGISEVDQWAPCKAVMNMADNTITITSSGEMPVESSFIAGNGTQKWDFTFTIDGKNWGMKDFYDIEGSVSFEANEMTKDSWSETKKQRKISFRLKKTSYVEMESWDKVKGYKEFGTTIPANQLFGNLSDTWNYEYHRFATEEEPEVYETESKDYKPKNDESLTFSIQIWEEEE